MSSSWSASQVRRVQVASRKCHPPSGPDDHPEARPVLENDHVQVAEGQPIDVAFSPHVEEGQIAFSFRGHVLEMAPRGS